MNRNPVNFFQKSAALQENFLQILAPNSINLSGLGSSTEHQILDRIDSEPLDLRTGASETVVSKISKQ